MEIYKQRTLSNLEKVIGELEYWQNKHSDFTEFFQSNINEAKSILMRVQDQIETELNKRGGKVVRDAYRIT